MLVADDIVVWVMFLCCFFVYCVCEFVSTLLTWATTRDNSWMHVLQCHTKYSGVSFEQSIKNAYQFLNLQQTRNFSRFLYLSFSQSDTESDIFVHTEYEFAWWQHQIFASYSVKYAHRSFFLCMQFDISLLEPLLRKHNPTFGDATEFKRWLDNNTTTNFFGMSLHLLLNMHWKLSPHFSTAAQHRSIGI